MDLLRFAGGPGGMPNTLLFDGKDIFYLPFGWKRYLFLKGFSQ